MAISVGQSYRDYGIPDFDILDWVEDHKKQVGALMIVSLLFVIAVPFPNNPLYTTGWETNVSIYEVTHNGITYGDNVGKYPWKSEYWGATSVRYDTDSNLELGDPPPFTEWEPDTTGCADTQIDLTNPTHVIFDTLSQTWIPATDDKVFYQYSKTVTYTNEAGEEMTKVYFWDHHVYTFWITVIAHPDTHHDGIYSRTECKEHSLNQAGQGAVSSVRVRVLFKAVGWDVGPDSFELDNDDGTTSTYTAIADTFWTGIMSASVMESYAGLVQSRRLEDGGVSGYTDAPTDPETGIVAAATLSGALNMYYVDGGGVDSWTDNDAQNNPDAIQGVPNEVLVEFYGELEPGFSWPLGGTIETSAVMFQYKARVDVLITGGYILASGQQPDDPVNPTIIDTGQDPIGDWIDNLLAPFTGLNPIVLLAVAIVVLIIIWKVLAWVLGGKD